MENQPDRPLPTVPSHPHLLFFLLHLLLLQIISDVAAIFAGGVAAGIYPTNGPEVRYNTVVQMINIV